MRPTGEPVLQDGDIWTSVDGKDWTLLTPTPGWSKRSGTDFIWMSFVLGHLASYPALR